MQVQATAVHGLAAQKHLERRDDLLRQARRFDFRTMHLEPHCSERNALIAQAELEHGMALACAQESGR